jgi:hypothetical protein
VAVAIYCRSVRREAILPKSSSSETAKSKVDSEDATRKHISSLCISLLTWRLDPLHHLFRISPKTEQKFRNIIRTANLEKGIKAPEFQLKKERILILKYLLENTNGLERDQIRNLADAVLIRRDLQSVLGLLKIAGKEDKGSGGFFDAAKDRIRIITFGMARGSKSTREEDMWREAINAAASVSDSRFLSQLHAAPVHECLHDATIEAEEAAYAYLRNRIKSLVDGIGKQIFSIQTEDCDRQILRDVTSGEDKELGILRSEFVHHIEDSSREHCRSYVHNSLE